MTEGIVNAFLDSKIRNPDATRAMYKIAGELDTDELRFGTAKGLQNACAALLDSATDATFDDLPDIAFTLLTAMNGTTRAVFEFGAQPRLVQMLRDQLLALCRGYLQIINRAGCASPRLDQQKKSYHFIVGGLSERLSDRQEANQRAF